jgi:group I intron endonuclease
MRGIYSITNTITGTIYYGQSKNIKKRWYRHKRDLKKGTHTSFLQGDWNKYGKDVFVFTPVELVEDITISLTPLEQKYYDSTTNKYNILRPGDPVIITLESRKKISEALKGRPRPDLIGNKNGLGWKAPDEWKQNQSNRMKGNTCSLGHKWILTEETKNKMSKVSNSRVRSEKGRFV